MKIAAEHVVILTFVVVDPAEDEVLDDAWARAPYAYIHGQGQMPRGFEEEVEGLEEGALFDFTLDPSRAYGDYNNQLVQKLDAAQFPEDLKPGMVVQMELPDQPLDTPPLLFHVKSIKEGQVRLDGNHPFAGKSLQFIGKIREVRLASARELHTGRIQRPAPDA